MPPSLPSYSRRCAIVSLRYATGVADAVMPPGFLLPICYAPFFDYYYDCPLLIDFRCCLCRYDACFADYYAHTPHIDFRCFFAISAILRHTLPPLSDVFRCLLLLSCRYTMFHYADGRVTLAMMPAPIFATPICCFFACWRRHAFVTPAVTIKSC